MTDAQRQQQAADADPPVQQHPAENHRSQRGQIQQNRQQQHRHPRPCLQYFFLHTIHSFRV